MVGLAHTISLQNKSNGCKQQTKLIKYMLRVVFSTIEAYLVTLTRVLLSCLKEAVYTSEILQLWQESQAVICRNTCLDGVIIIITYYIIVLHNLHCRMKELNIPVGKRHVLFGQIYGMADSVTYSLGKQHQQQNYQQQAVILVIISRLWRQGSRR